MYSILWLVVLSLSDMNLLVLHFLRLFIAGYHVVPSGCHDIGDHNA